MFCIRMALRINPNVFLLFLYDKKKKYKSCFGVKMKVLAEVRERSVLLGALRRHLSLLCHKDKLLVLWLLELIGVGLELTEAVKDNVVLKCGAVRTLGSHKSRFSLNT